MLIIADYIGFVLVINFKIKCQQWLAFLKIHEQDKSHTRVSMKKCLISAGHGCFCFVM